MNEASPDLKEEYKRAITLFATTLIKQLEKHYLNLVLTIKIAQLIVPISFLQK